ncbi:zinc transporter ZIP1-like [Macrobrachium nipponense]|uniref:zinc transporter ZIP1-like n=1 Tax=Macrobrachium nipponense TaxID=159736 RepID=UPI0030C83F56
MEVEQAQFLAIGIIFTINSMVGLAPVLLKGNLPDVIVPQTQTRNRLLSAASCFGAGVFLFVCFMGLLPDADHKFHHFLEDIKRYDEEWTTFTEFPWAFFVVTVGFLSIFTLDKMIHAVEHSRKGGQDGLAHFRRQLPPVESSKKDGDAEKSLIGKDCVHHHDDEDEGHGVPSSVIFLVALGIHSVFEGMAVGLQTQTEKVMELGVAVFVHEVVMAFTFGMEVSRSNTLSRIYKVVYVVVFSATIPLGVAIGFGLQNAPSDHRDIISAVFEAFATGIFVHVIFIEVLSHEFSGHHHHGGHHAGGKDSEGERTSPSETYLILEKVSFICLGLLTLIMLSIFLHHHHH